VEEGEYYSSISVSWNWVPDATGYNIYRKAGNYGDYYRLTSTPSTSYIDNLYSPNTYYYMVRAYNSAGESSPSSTYAIIPLGVPSGVTAVVKSSSSITVSWNGVSEASEYYIYRSTSSEGDYDFIDSTSNQWDTEYTDTSLSASTAYYYKVAAYNSGGTGSQSSNVSAVTYPATPLNVTAAAASATGITISWTASTGAAGYNIYRSSDSGGSYSKIGSSTGTSYANTGLTTGSKYYYKVSAYNSGESALSQTAFAVAVSFGTLSTTLTQKTIAYGAEQWYRVSVNASYDWWLEWRKDRTSTDISVTAWDSAGNLLGSWYEDNYFSDNRTYGGSIFTGKNEYIYVRVTGLGSGFYTMRYYNYSF
jgi:fibronectin type 3 domain-containing protein